MMNMNSIRRMTDITLQDIDEARELKEKGETVIHQRDVIIPINDYIKDRIETFEILTEYLTRNLLRK